MNIDELREEIATDEGKVMSVYLDPPQPTYARDWPPHN